MKISGVLTLRNAIEAGYPFMEVIHSAVPPCDEFLICDGGSDDGTYETLEKLENIYPKKISLYTREDERSDRWETVDKSLEMMIDEAQGEWIFESQADEVWKNSMRIRNLLNGMFDFNSIRQPRFDINQNWGRGYVHETVRIVRNMDDLRSYEGGDSFHLGRHKEPTEGYTCHNVQPEFYWNVPFYHLEGVFKDNEEEKARRHAEFLATKQDIRKDKYEQLTKNS